MLCVADAEALSLAYDVDDEDGVNEPLTVAVRVHDVDAVGVRVADGVTLFETLMLDDLEMLAVRVVDADFVLLFVTDLDDVTEAAFRPRSRRYENW
jgi:hypothetical protein